MSKKASLAAGVAILAVSLWGWVARRPASTDQLEPVDPRAPAPF